MFDNLKKKLGSFRKDAEEAAEENVEEVDEDELEEPGLDEDELRESELDEGADTDAEPTADTAVEGEADAAGEPDTVETDAGTDAEPASEQEVPDTTPTDAETADPDAAGGDTDRTTASATEPAPAAASESGDGEADAVEPSEPTDPVTETEPAANLEVEPAESDAGADDSAVLESDAETEPEIDADPEPAPSAESAVDVDERSEPTADAEIGPADDDTVEPTADAEDAPADADDSAPEADDDSNDTGFGAKARSLVRGKFVIEEEDLEGPLHELEMALLTSDVEMGVAEEIIENIREELVGETRTFATSTGEVVEDALRDAIYDVISVGQFDFDERIAVEDKPVTIIFTGVNGVGKTTSIAKLSRYFEERGYSVVMANGDTYRAGANQQIQQHADALDTKCISHEQGGDPAAVLYDAVEYAEANDVDVVLGDTAGRLHTNEGLMDQLEKIERVVGPDLTLFVDEAVAGQDAVNRAREFNEAAAIDGAILTKADADSNGGAAISIAHVTGKPILFLGVGQGYDHLERFDPDEMIDRLLADEE
jgi:fused signal recognition particle receptor